MTVSGIASGANRTLPVPIVDLSLPEEQAGAITRAACLDHGFFHASNHGVPDELIQRMFEQSRKFFRSPVELKEPLKGYDTQGYTGSGGTNLDTQTTKYQTREVYGIIGTRKEDGKLAANDGDPNTTEHCEPYHYPNRWPDETALPELKKTFSEYIAAMSPVHDKLIRLIALALNLPATYFDDKFDDAIVKMMVIRYPEQPSDVEKGIFAAAPHTDFGFLNALMTDGTPGLQLFYEGEWVDVPPVPGTFQINIGDILERWTNGQFKSTLHRVVKLNDKERFATSFFMNPNNNAKVEAISTCVSEDNPAKYPPCGALAYLNNCYHKIGYKRLTSSAGIPDLYSE